MNDQEREEFVRLRGRFDLLQKRWLECPSESRERVLSFLLDQADKIESHQDAATLYRLFACMQNLPDVMDIEWLNAQRNRALEALQVDIVAQAPEVAKVARLWSAVDGDGLLETSDLCRGCGHPRKKQPGPGCPIRWQHIDPFDQLAEQIGDMDDT